MATRAQSDHFEFFTKDKTTSDYMCAADDVILHGKLLPFGQAPPPPPQSDSSEFRPRGFWGGSKTKGEYRKLKRVSHSDAKGAPSDQRKPRPRWYVLVFGSVRVPAGMEMKEIRIRQRRLITPLLERREVDSDEWGPWKLLRSLSCKGMDAVV